MDMRCVGQSGLRVSAVGLGCNNFGWTIDAATSQEVVDRALDRGITMFDTADFYGTQPGDSERVLGAALGARRKEIVLASKFGVVMNGGGRLRDSSRRYVMSAVEASLDRLQTDWLDIYMIHWPDPQTPIEETLRALDDLVRDGKVRYIACSNLATWRIVDALWTSREHRLERFVAAEDQYSLLARGAEADIIPALKHFGLGLFPYFPLAGGLLTGKYTSGNRAGEGRLSRNFLKLGDSFLSERNLSVTRSLHEFAQSRGRTLLELAISWLLAQPAVSSVICGATSPGQVDLNAAAASWALDRGELGEIDRITAAAAK